MMMMAVMVCEGKSGKKAWKKKCYFDAAVTIDCCIKKESDRVQEDAKKTKNGNEGVRKNKPKT